MKKVSMEKIAQKAGVSKSTVSNALSGKDHMLSEETKKRILQIAEECGYQKKNHLIRFVVFERRVLPESRKIDHDPKFKILYTSMKRQCCLFHYRIAVNHIKEMDKEKGFGYIRKISDCDGLIILGWELTIDDLRWLREFLNIPFVVIDAAFSDPKYDFVTNNNVDAAYQLTQRMIDCGHRRIGFIHGGDMEVFDERSRGYQNALIANNLEYDRSIVCRVERKNKSEFVEEIREFLLKLSKRNTPMPTAFLACDDRIAVSFLAASIALNMDFSLAGFDNLPVCLEQTPQLASVEPDYSYIGVTAVKRIVEKISSGETKTQKIYTEPNIYYRESIAVLNKKKNV
ncbi:LacI family DNA-binding transcriptional regulator [Lactimicrobium massiliense]|uniref:LacI family DNA-binding transcriptional regulator n=1 Tax=Lactimicrobium massiliense TaxID=2161814 RepID=UPI000D55641B|nr:LacI family DNA-binding transcriptional regulator [Lactimicrobium massiliense]